MAHDREHDEMEKGDRVRIVAGSGWQSAADGTRVRLIGEYAYVTDSSQQLSVKLRLEEYPEIFLTMASHEVQLAPGMVEPEIHEPQLAQSSADVELIERFPSHGRLQYSTYRIGEGEGTATLVHHTNSWELDFADLGISDVDGGSAGEYDDSPLGAWNAWNRMRGLLSQRS